jgi:hypothetical protein
MIATEFKVPPALDNWINKARKDSDQVDSLLKSAVFESAQNVVKEAVRIVPIMTGKLADSIKADYLDDGLMAVVGSYLPYAAKWEYSVVEHPVIGRGEIKRLGKNGELLTRERKTGRILGNTNPNATWGYMRKALFSEQRNFLEKLLSIARGYA